MAVGTNAHDIAVVYATLLRIRGAFIIIKKPVKIYRSQGISLQAKGMYRVKISFHLFQSLLTDFGNRGMDCYTIIPGYLSCQRQNPMFRLWINAGTSHILVKFGKAFYTRFF